MSELEEIFNVGDSTIFHGHTLSQPRYVDIATAESQAKADYIREIHNATLYFSPEESQVYRQRAADNLLNGFTFGWRNFDSWAQSKLALPFLAWLCFRQTEKQMTLAQAGDITANATIEQVNRVHEIWGYFIRKKKDVTTKTIEPLSTGEGSSTTSASHPQKGSATESTKSES